MGFESLLSHVSISETVNRAALAWVRATADPEATKIMEIRENSYDAGGCDTCGHDIVIEVDVIYDTPKWSGYGTRTFKGSFTEFIRTLDEYDI